MKRFLNFTISIIFIITSGLYAVQNFNHRSVQSPSFEIQTVNTNDFPRDTSLNIANKPIGISDTIDSLASLQEDDVQSDAAYAFNNPAGCPVSAPAEQTPEAMLSNVQSALGDSYNLTDRREYYIWNGELGSMVNVTDDRYVYEFIFNNFQPPLTYLADQVATVFLNNGFVVWFRIYGGNFRLTAIPMVPEVYDSIWASYLSSYWEVNGMPQDDYIYPVIKKLPCHWIVDEGYVSNETLQAMFNFNWHIPDFLADGQQYLAQSCEEANRVAQERIGYYTANTMCGPLAWRLMSDVNGFPYRIGSWSGSADAFTAANPRWNGQPWGSFDPDTFTLTHIETAMAGYDFQANGNLYPGDLIYSFASLYVTPGYYDHIFLVAGVDENGSRLSVSNMIQNYPVNDCSIQQVVLYTPGDRETGVINYEWNNHGFGITGSTGFDIFRWNWITYHIEGVSQSYAVRWGDTIETIAFDWKVSPESLAAMNNLPLDAQLEPGQIITLPVPEPFEMGA
jgi:hypothetical protein